MKVENSFNNHNNNKTEDVKTPLSDLELLNILNKWSSEENNKMDISNKDFLDNFEKTIPLNKRDEFRNEVNDIQSKYRNKKVSFTKKLIKGATKFGLISGGAIVGSLTLLHIFAKDIPDNLPINPEKKEVVWDNKTEKEVERLTDDYVLFIQEGIKKDSAHFEGITEEMLRERLINFLKDYAPDINITHIGEESSAFDRFEGWFFKNVLKQRESRAHYAPFDKIFYEKKDSLEYYEDGEIKKESSSFGDFMSELSHHINNDWSFGRAGAYVKGLERKSFNQNRMYDDAYSPEYQAHTLTGSAIGLYLTMPKNEWDISFAEVYNTNLDYYREFLKFNNKEGSGGIDGLMFDVLYRTESFTDLKNKKEIVFKDLNDIHNVLDSYKGVLNPKQINSMSEFLIDETFMRDTGNIRIEYASAMKDALLSGDKVINLVNKKEFSEILPLVKDLLKNDDKYLHSSLIDYVFTKEFTEATDSVFDKGSFYSMLPLIQAKRMMVFKNLEGEILGKDYCRGADMYPSSVFRSNLRSLHKYHEINFSTKKVDGDDILYKNFSNAYKDENDWFLLSQALNCYSNNELNELEKLYTQTSSGSKQEGLIIKMISDLRENLTHDFNRGYLLNGKSPIDFSE